jgi:hypothetical protein
MPDLFASAEDTRFGSGVSFCMQLRLQSTHTTRTVNFPPCQLHSCIQSSHLPDTLAVLSMSSVVVGDTQCEVVLVGCGAPNRGMGWYEIKSSETEASKRVVVRILKYTPIA